MPTLKLNIAFDLDGTLVDLNKLFKKVLYENTGATVIENGKFEYETDIPVGDFTISDTLGQCFKRIKDIPVFSDVKRLMKNLYLAGEGDPITIITARPHWAANDTYRLLNRIFKDIPFRLIMVKNGKNKIKYLRGIDFFVDDRRKTAIQISQHGKTVFVPRKSYNEINFDVDGIEFIDTVADLIPLVDTFKRVDVRYA